MLNRFGHSFRKGDTLIEVMFAVGVFGLAAVGAISLMNRGLAAAQNTLEVTMARQEIDGQAEILRFLHTAYMSSKDPISEDPCGDPLSYRVLCKCITSDQYVYNPDEIKEVDKDFYGRTVTPGEHCDTLFHADGKNDEFSVPSRSFVLNYRSLGSTDFENTSLNQVISQSSLIHTTGTYPRLIFTNNSVNCEKDENKNKPECNLSDATAITNAATIQKKLQAAEGVWVTAVASESGVQCVGEDNPRPDFYDFHIQTCWDAVAGNTPSTIGSTIRLFNPDQVQPVKKTSSLSLDEMAMFFVMTWKGSNTDIDAHLEGSKESPTSNNAFHVYYGHKTAGEKKRYSFTTSEVSTFQLDVDSVNNKNYNSTNDRNCGSKDCGDGAIEIIAFRSLFPATFKYYLYDFAGKGLANNNLKVRVFIGKADSGVGIWPFDTEPIATFEYPSNGSGRTWNVAEFTVQEDGSFIINGNTYTLGEEFIGDVEIESSCVRHSY